MGSSPVMRSKNVGWIRVKKELATIIKVLLQQQFTISDMQAENRIRDKLVVSSHFHCRKVDCNNRATVVHELANIALCDRCCAEAMVATGKRIMMLTSDSDVEIVNYALVIEELWVDLPCANDIRMIQDRIENTNSQIH